MRASSVWNFIPLFGLIVLSMVPNSSSTDADVESGEPLGKKLLSYPTLVSILKARNSTRPNLSPGTAQHVANMQLGMQPALQLLAATPHASSLIPSLPSKNKHICAPASQEKSNEQIARLCAGRRKGDTLEVADGSPSKCMERYCVSIIPEADDDDDLAKGFGTEVIAYTECDAVSNLFKKLGKNITPKCYDCSR